MRDWIDLFESEYPLADGFKNDFVRHVNDYYGEPDGHETGTQDFESWYEKLNDLHTEGGSIYRVIYVKKGEMPTKPFGMHWSMKALDEQARWRLWNDVCAYCEGKRLDPHEDNGMEEVLIHAKTPPNNVSVEGVNVPEEWQEWEILLKDESVIQVVSMTRARVPQEC